MNYIGISKYDTANGPGVRVSLFVSGCSIHCKGCFNPESWSFDAGKLFTAETKAEILKALDSPYVAGFSLLGGDPFEPEHEECLIDLLRSVKAAFPEKPVWAWTGRTLEHVEKSPLMSYIDMLVDGPFIEKKKIEHPVCDWKGSTNQRVIPIVAGKADLAKAK